MQERKKHKKKVDEKMILESLENAKKVDGRILNGGARINSGRPRIPNRSGNFWRGNAEVYSKIKKILGKERIKEFYAAIDTFSKEFLNKLECNSIVFAGRVDGYGIETTKQEFFENTGLKWCYDVHSEDKVEGGIKVSLYFKLIEKFPDLKDVIDPVTVIDSDRKIHYVLFPIFTEKCSKFISDKCKQKFIDFIQNFGFKTYEYKHFKGDIIDEILYGKNIELLPIIKPVKKNESI